MKKLYKVLVITLFIVTCGFATTINVPADQTTIQAGIDAASDGDTVLVAAGTYVENINFNGKNIVVGSLYLTTQDTSYISSTIIDGDANGFPVVHFESGESNDAKLIGLTVQNGLTMLNEWGAGIDIRSSSTPTLDHLIIQNNNAQSGRGGGIAFYYAGSTTILKNLIIRNNNCSDYGGGIYVFNSTIDLSNSKIYGNTGAGSALYLWHGSYELPISNCLIRDNAGSLAIRSRTAVSFLNCTIFNNDGSIEFEGNSAIINTIVGSGHDISNTGILNISHSLIEDGENSITTPLGASTTWG